MESLCISCEFFQDTEDAKGYCHRYPPTLTAALSNKEVSSNPSALSMLYEFPIVDDVAWCGEFKRKGSNV